MPIELTALLLNKEDLISATPTAPSEDFCHKTNLSREIAILAYRDQFRVEIQL